VITSSMMRALRVAVTVKGVLASNQGKECAA